MDDEELARQLAAQLGSDDQEAIMKQFIREEKQEEKPSFSEWDHPSHQHIPDVDTLSQSLRQELPDFSTWKERIESHRSFPPMMPFERDALMNLHTSRIPIYPHVGFPQTIEEIHFRIAESQVLRLLGSAKIIKVERVVNPVLWNRYVMFGQTHDVQEELLLFHGTENMKIQSILDEGFKIGGIDVPIATGAVHGKGVYLSEDPSFALRYVRQQVPKSDVVDTFNEKGSKCLLFVKCAITKDTRKVMNAAGTLHEQVICPSKSQVLPFYLVYVK